MEDRSFSHPLLVFFSIYALSAFQVAGANEIILSGDSGSILSPNYPNNYKGWQMTTYRAVFTTPAPLQVRLSVDYEFGAPVLSSCFLSDYITINSGPRLCGTSSYVQYMTLSVNQIAVFFYSNGILGDKGFNITYVVIAGTCQPATMWIAGTGVTYWLPITDLPERKSLVFSIRGCKSAVNFAMGDDQANPLLNAWQIIIGEKNNTKTTLKRCKSDASDVHTCSGKASLNHSALSCCEFRSFWVEWELQRIYFGTGGVINKTEAALFGTASSVSVDVKWLFVGGAADFLISLDAPFTDDYCVSPPDQSPPAECVPTTTEAPVSTPPFTLTLTPEQKPCICIQNPKPDPTLTAEEAKQMLEAEKQQAAVEIAEGLSVDAHNVSKFVRKKTTAQDDRTTVMATGALVGVVCLVPLATIVLTDLFSVLRYLLKCRKQNEVKNKNNTKN